MSGVETLGAAASVVGVAGAVKTCIDLLDILSTARSAERDLEDLLVHLQWQRIRFYCWVLETGFADVIIDGQHEPNRMSPDSKTLPLLPREFRIPFFLLHIQRTITNMNMRLQATEKIIQKYSTKKTRSPWGWGERMARFLDTIPTNSLVASPPVATESRKLGLWEKMRWVGVDVKELTHLVGTLRQYNAELEALLPLSRLRSFERRVERGLITSRQLSNRLAAPNFASHVLADSEGLQQARHYRSLITLLENSEQQQSQPVVEGRDEEGEIMPSVRSPTRDRSMKSLNLHMADIKFVNSKATERTDREFVSYGPAPVILEWRHYSTKTTAAMSSYLDSRVHNLAMQLRQLSTISNAGTLSCPGYIHDEKNSRYGLVFEYPKGCSASTPISLRERLKLDHEARTRRDLNERFDLARVLILTVYRQLSVNWLHKNLSSENILLFEASVGENGIQRPYVCGFSFARRDAKFELSEKLPSIYHDTFASVNERLYWHPDRLASSQARDNGESSQDHNFRTAGHWREFDVYSLGILLLEIGFWCPIERIYRDHGTDALSSFAAELQSRYVPALRGRMGKTYSQIVGCCLEGRFGSVPDGERSDADDEYLIRMRSFLEEFERQVVSKIEGLLVT